MAYQSLCARFREEGTLTIALAVGAGSHALVNTLMNGGVSDAVLSSAVQGVKAGGCAWLAGALAEIFVQEILSAKRVGVSRGSRILQQCEMAVYGLALSAALYVNQSDFDATSNRTVSPVSEPDKTTAVPASSSTLPLPPPKIS